MSIGELLSQYGEKYLSAMLMTWELTFLAFLLALIIGIAITVFRIWK